MIYMDDMGHLISDESLEELHAFAVNKLGFRRSWYQDKGELSHYDLTTANAKHRAVTAGAITIGTKELIKKLKEAPYNKG
jgi:hypothetical protein